MGKILANLTLLSLLKNMHYRPWSVINIVETLPQLPNKSFTTTATTITSSRCSSDNPLVDSGRDTLDLQTLYNTSQQVNSTSKSFEPRHISTPYPKGPLSYPQTPHFTQPFANDIVPFYFQSSFQVITTQPTT